MFNIDILVMHGASMPLSKMIKVETKAMIRSRYNQIPHLALNSEWERDTYNLDGTNIKTARLKSQGDGSFPTDGHKAILNKLNINEQ